MKKSRIWATLHPFFEEGGKLGRTEANRSFLQALIMADSFESYHFFLPYPKEVNWLKGRLNEFYPDLYKEGRFSVRLRREFPQAVFECDYHCLHLSDPFRGFDESMSIRNGFSRRIFPITCITHSLSYAEYGQGFLKHMWPGVTERDCVVSSSRAGARVVENFYKSLRGAYGPLPAPTVRQIPLGVEPAELPAAGEKDALRREAQARFNLGNEVIFLVFARISYQSKMDLLPLLRAFKVAESKGLNAGQARLVLAGWLEEDDPFGEDILRLAANLGIKCTLVPRPDDRERKLLYAAADVFLSPSDNIQETFGLTMLEAAISGLPIIASEFDGYKDLVRHEVTGYLVPSYGPERTGLTDALSVMVPASEYHLLLAQQCAVDVDGLGGRIARLGGDEGLRQRMGQAGRERALREYTWQAVARRYIDLWNELNALPCELDGEPADRPPERLRHPIHPGFMDIFGDYYSMRISDLDATGQRVCWTEAGEAIYRGKEFPVIYSLVEGRIDLDALKRFLFKARNPVAIRELRKEAGPETALLQDSDFLLLWALKHGLLRVEK